MARQKCVMIRRSRTRARRQLNRTLVQSLNLILTYIKFRQCTDKKVQEKAREQEDEGGGSGKRAGLVGLRSFDGDLCAKTFKQVRDSGPS